MGIIFVLVGARSGVPLPGKHAHTLSQTLAAAAALAVVAASPARAPSTANIADDTVAVYIGDKGARQIYTKVRPSPRP